MGEEKESFKKAIILLFKYYGQEENIELIRMYIRMLSDYEYKFIINRIKNIILTSKDRFLPKIAEIIDPIVAKEKEQAWLAFRDSFERKCNGSYEEVPHDVYTIKRIVGFRRVADANRSEWHWVMRDVRDVWEKMQAGIYQVENNPCLEERTLA